VAAEKRSRETKRERDREREREREWERGEQCQRITERISLARVWRERDERRGRLGVRFPDARVGRARRQETEERRHYARIGTERAPR